MVGVIFSAGLGTRLKPLTDTMPKALVPLAGKPLLQWQVEKLRAAGITDIIVNVHHFPDMIIDAVRQNEGWGANILISDERDQLLDTGGGLKKILNSQLSTLNSPILACNVDILSNIDVRALISAYERTGVSQLVVSDRQTQRYLCFDGQNQLCGWTNMATGELKGTDGRHLAFSGMQILSPDALALLNEMPDEKFSLIDFYLKAMNKLPLQAYVPGDYRMMDVGKIDQIEEAERFAESL
jgi:NDP-sugar pyrophosphorylase family protein